MKTALAIRFAPLLSGSPLWSLCAAALLLLVLSIFIYRRSLVPRGICAAAFILLLLNPSVVEEQRESVPDVAAIVVDHSPSQNMGERLKRTDDAVAHLKKTLKAADNNLVEAAQRIFNRFHDRVEPPAKP